MGQVLQRITEGAGPEMKESLAMLKQMMESKKEYYEKVLPDAALGDKTLKALAVVDKFQQYRITSSKKPGGITDAIDSFLKKDWQQGIKNSLVNIITAFLGGSGVAGEQTMEHMTINFTQNSLVRHDIVIFKYKVESESFVSKEIDLAVFYYVQTSVLDIRNIDPSILMFEMSKAVTDPDTGKVDSDHFHEMIRELEQLSEYAGSLFKTLRILGHAQKEKDELPSLHVMGHVHKEKDVFPPHQEQAIEICEKSIIY